MFHITFLSYPTHDQTPWHSCGIGEEVPITLLEAAVMTSLDIKKNPLKIKSKINAVVQDLDNAGLLPGN